MSLKDWCGGCNCPVASSPKQLHSDIDQPILTQACTVLHTTMPVHFEADSTALVCCWARVPLFLWLQILEHVAAALGKDSAEVKAANFLPEVTAAAAAGLPSSPGSSINSDSGCSTHDLTYSSSDSSSSADLCDDGARAPSSPGSAATSAQDDCLQQPQANGACTVAEGSNSRSVSSAPQSAAAAAASGAVVSTALGRLIAAESYTLPRLWRELLQSSKHAERLEAVRRHNTQHAWSKRGLVVTPVR